VGKRGVKGYDVSELPYNVKVYVNNQVLIPAKLVRSLGIEGAKRARVTFEYEGAVETVEVNLLKTRYTSSRQFTIPKEVRAKLNLKPDDEIRIIDIKAIK